MRNGCNMIGSQSRSQKISQDVKKIKLTQFIFKFIEEYMYTRHVFFHDTKFT